MKHPNAVDVPLPTPEEMRSWYPLRPEDLLGERNDRNPYIHYVPRDDK